MSDNDKLTPHEQGIQLVLNTLMKHLPVEFDTLCKDVLDPDYPFHTDEVDKYLEIVKATKNVMAILQKIIDEGGDIKYVNEDGEMEDLGYL